MGKADTVLARFVPNFPAATGKPIDERLVYDEVSRETVRAAVYERDTLVAGQAIRGTAIVVEPDSTLYVPSDSLATVDAFGNLLISIGAG
jgi:N-methylhydantoinase A